MQTTVDLPVFTISGPINPPLAKEFATFLNKAESNNAAEDIILQINSEGGCCDTMFSIIHLMQFSSKTIHTVNLGVAMSAGFFIFLAGDTRWAAPYSRFLHHNAWTITWGDADEIRGQVEDHLDRIRECADDLLKKNTNKTPAWWNKQVMSTARKEFVFDANDAITYGVAEAIGVPRIEPHVALPLVSSQKDVKRFRKAVTTATTTN